MVFKSIFLTEVFFAALLMGAGTSVCQANDGQPAPLAAAERPKELEGVGIEEKLRAQLDLTLPFKDEDGNTVTLAKFFNGKNPVIISPVYYSCPGLCNFHLNGLVDALKGVDWSPGQKFEVVAISFDPKETPDVAKKKKETYMKVYSRPGTENGFHFLTGDAETVKAFTSAIGFKYKWLEKEEEWSHASAAIVTSPQGIISRYLPGIIFQDRDVKLALNEAAQGKIGTFVDSLVLYCFQYNPHSSQYTLAVFNVMKLGGALMILILALWLIPFWRRNLRTKA